MRKSVITFVVLATSLTASHGAHAQFVCQGMNGIDGGNDASGGVTCGVNNTNQASTGLGVAFGYSNYIFSSGGVAVGINSSAIQGGVAFGKQASASGINSSAFGQSSNAIGQSSIALGGAYASGDQSIALGSGANARYSGSTAIGYSAEATAANQMMLGSSLNTYVMPGIVSKNSLDAQSGTTSLVTTDAGGHLATTSLDLGAAAAIVPQVNAQQATIDSHTTAIQQIQTEIGGFQSQIDGLSHGLGVLGAGVSALNSRVDGNQREARSGIAMASAIAHAPLPSAPGKTTWRVNTSQFKGYIAHSVSFSHRLPTNIPLAISASVAGGRAGVIVAAGVQGEF